MTPIIDYSGKTVVITGAATGVGAELVTLLRGAGPERIIAVDIKACDGPVDDTIITDLADPNAIDDMISRLPAVIDTRCPLFPDSRDRRRTPHSLRGPGAVALLNWPTMLGLARQTLGAP
ncbi:MAG TPA: hypothetical protein VGG53_05295 [Mycobacterium sp.]|uniref:hypothetical protein n=1 Tax=Mycobacterium sp. TaxID=1785 RepID=UPI002F421662